jgi:Ca2+-binding EF-hand superfamily protein
MKMTFSAVAMSLALAATNATAQQPQGTTGTMKNLENAKPEAVFASWDDNGNNQLSQQEFMAGLRNQNWFQRVDADSNRRISKAEFKTQLKAMNVHQRADLNNDGSVGQPEANRLLGENRAAAWNTRQPASISEDELYEGLYNAWSKDASAGLTQEEMLAGAFACADRDNDGMITEAEFARDVAVMKGNAPNRMAGMSHQSGRDRDGSDQPVGTTGAVAAATVESIVDNPDAYIGERVTVSGDVGDVFGQRVFNIEEHGVIDVDDELLVVAPKNSTMVTADSTVQVHGTVRRIVTSDLEMEYGPTYWTHWGVDRDFFTTRETRPVIFAETIDVRR